MSQHDPRSSSNPLTLREAALELALYAAILALALTLIPN